MVRQRHGTTMTQDGEPDSHPDHRAFRDVPGESIEYRQPDDEDGVFEVRMPIATTGEVRNEGDDPLTRDELDGMARQIDDRGVGVFLDHGRSPIGGRGRYSATEKIGEWTEAEVRERETRDVEGDERADGMDELAATARLMDPETLPAASGMLREALASIKEQVKRDMSLASSIGWREDDSYPGGVDLMEASIVGIGADPRTTSEASAVVARAAVDAGADPEALVDAVRDAVDTGDHEMSDEDTESDTEADAEHDDEPDESREAPEWADRMLELLEDTNATLQTVAEAVREDDEDDQPGGDEDDEGDDEEDDEEEDDEQAADDADEERDLASEVEALREELAEVRSGDPGEGVDTPDAEPDVEQDADDDETETRGADELTTKYGIQ